MSSKIALVIVSVSAGICAYVGILFFVALASGYLG